MTNLVWVAVRLKDKQIDNQQILRRRPNSKYPTTIFSLYYQILKMLQEFVNHNIDPLSQYVLQF